MIIDEADALVPPAQNALLKTLEEPPPSSVFILVTSRPDVLLPTVLSRCPQLRFRPLVDRRHRRGADGARTQRSGSARGRGDRGRQPRPGAAGRARRDLVEARDVARARAGAGGALERDPRATSGDSRRICSPKPASAASTIAISWRLHLRAMAVAPARRRALLATGADERALANADVRPALERLTLRIDGERGIARVRGRRSRAGRARAQRRRQDGRRLAGAAAMSTAAASAARRRQAARRSAARRHYAARSASAAAPCRGPATASSCRREGGPAVGTVVRAIPQLDAKRRPPSRLAAARRPRRHARGHRRPAAAPAPRARGAPDCAAENPRARARHEAGAGRAGRSTVRS